MLTKGDLSKIKAIVHNEVVVETGRALDAKMKPMLDKELKPIRQDIAKIRKDMTTIVSFFDREYLDLRARVERIEDHLHLSPAS